MTGLKCALTPMALSAMMLLGGCMTSTQYDAVSQALKGSPALLKEGVDQCVANNNRSTKEQKDLTLKLMNLKPGSDAIRIGCQRIFDAIASGKISYADYQELQTSRVTPKLVSVLQNR